MSAQPETHGSDEDRTAPNPEPESEQELAAALGRRIGPYRVVGVLGRGGMGTVFLAEDERDGRRVALKTHAEEPARKSDSGRQRFMHEARAVGRLHHPGIVPLVDSGRDGETVYYCMDVVDGVPLDQWVSEQRPDFKTLAGVIEEVCRALEYAHQQAIVHRDIKPSNILVDHDSQPHLVDFGLVRDMANPHNLTQDSGAIGTPQYMAPEQAMNQRDAIGPHTDIWAIGAVLYETLTGQQPFGGDTVYDSFRAIVEQDPPPLRSIRPEIPPALDAITCRCLDKTPRRRYASALALAEDLARYRGSSRVAARSPGLVRSWRRFRRRHRLLVWIVLAVTITGAAWAGWAYTEWRKRHAEWRRVASWKPIEHSGNWVIYESKLDDHQRVPASGPVQLGGGKWIGLREPGLAGGVRVTVEVELAETDVLELVLNASEERLDIPWWTPAGSCARLETKDEPPAICRMGFTPQAEDWDEAASHRGLKGLQIGTRHQVTFTVGAEQRTLALDGVPLLSQPTIRPRSAGGSLYIRAYRPSTRFYAITVDRLALPRYANPIHVADALYRAGLHDRALNEYLALARAHRGNSTGEQALARACQVAMEQDQPDPARVRDLLNDFERRYPDSRMEQPIRWVEARYHCADQRWSAALSAAERLLALNPAAGIDQELADRIRQQRVIPPPAIGYRLAELMTRRPELKDLDCSQLGLERLPPIANHDIRGINVSGNRLRDLEGLAGLAPEKLHCSGNPLQSLAGLDTSRLTRLEASHCQFDSVESLREAKHLRALSLTGNAVRDLEPLRHLPLRELLLADCPIDRLLAWPQLTRLDVSNNGEVDLAPLRQCPALTFLLVERAQLINQDALEGLSLETLACGASNFSNTAALANPALTELWATATPVRDLAPLAGTRLERLDVSNTQVSDVAPLAELPLTTLLLAGSRVTDLRPLESLQLGRLDVQNAPITHFGRFLADPPADFVPWTDSHDANHWRDWAARWQIDHPDLSHYTRHWLSLRDLPPSQWRSRATATGGELTLFVPLRYRIHDALTLAQELGARLPVEQWGSASQRDAPTFGRTWALKSRFATAIEPANVFTGYGLVRRAGPDMRAWLFLIWER